MELNLTEDGRTFVTIIRFLSH